jgi:enoyl-CoA hydratase/carnithine racemase
VEATTEAVRYAKTAEHVAVMRIDQPRTRNALSTEVLTGLSAGLDSAEHDDDVRAVVITGGPQFFASGADIRQLRDTTAAGYLLSERQSAWLRFARFPKPMVAAASGYVLGGGCELALLCDLVVASDTAVFGQPEIRLGIIPGAGGTQRWSHAVGRYRAAEMVLEARTVDAWTAAKLGVVAEVVPGECIVEAGIEHAARIARFSPVAARLGKSALRASEKLGIDDGIDYERHLMGVLLSTDDRLEGMDAFLEKRPATFTGR